jgi:hypothetical protein
VCPDIRSQLQCSTLGIWFSVPFRLPSSTPSNQSFALGHNNLLEGCSSKQPCLYLIRWDGIKLVYSQILGKCHQSRIGTADTYVVHNRVLASVT